MESIKNATLIKFLTARDFKSRCIKLAILLAAMTLGLFNDVFVVMAFAICAIYTLFEYSADSLIWIITTAIYMPYSCAALTFFLMWILSGLLLLKLIIDLKNKKVSLKSWRMITMFSLFGALCLLILLPLCKSYSFGSQLNKFSLFSLVILALIYVKEINVKDTLILFVYAVVSIGIITFILNQFDLATAAYVAEYSNGILLRFSPFSKDPNFSGAITICAMMAWFVAYKRNFINKYLYFGILLVLGSFILMTISKACYLIVAAFALYVIIENIVITIKTKNAKHLIELGYYLGVLLIACAICWQYIDSMYQRILNPEAGWWSEGNEEVDISKLTTGRFDLWIGYIKAIFSSPQILLFGAGAKSDYIGPGATHSMPLDYLYRYGLLVVLVLIALFVVAVLPYLKKAKPYNFIPLICITGIFCSIGSISVKYIYMFSIIFLTLCCNGITDKEDKSTDEESRNKQKIEEVDNN